MNPPLPPTPLSRRDFITGVGASLASLAAGASAAPLSYAPTAIDTHVHFFSPKMLKHAHWDASKTPARFETADDFIRMAAPAGVAGIVSIEAIDTMADVEENQWALDQAHSHPFLLGYIGRLEPGDKDFPAQLKRFAADPLFRGIRPRRQFDDLAGCMADPEFHRHLRMLAERGLVFESGGLPSAIPLLTNLAHTHSDLPIVFEHLPLIDSEREDPAELRYLLAKAAELTNVTAKISHIMMLKGGRPIRDPAAYQPGLDAMFSLFGPDRVMYGSDWPKPSGIADYGFIHHLAAEYVRPLGHKQAEKFFWRNAVRAYGLNPGRVERVISA